MSFPHLKDMSTAPTILGKNEVSNQNETNERRKRERTESDSYNSGPGGEECPGHEPCETWKNGLVLPRQT